MRALRRVVVGVFVLACAVAIGGCAYPGSKECAENFTAEALAVDGVAAANFECGGTFGNPYERGEIFLETEDEGKANEIIANIYRAYAGNLAIDGADRPSVEFLSSSDSSVEFYDFDLGFKGPPSVTDMREKYCDDLDCESGVTK